MLCAKFGWNRPSGSGEGDFFNLVNVFSLFCNYLPLESFQLRWANNLPPPPIFDLGGIKIHTSISTKKDNKKIYNTNIWKTDDNIQLNADVQRHNQLCTNLVHINHESRESHRNTVQAPNPCKYPIHTANHSQFCRNKAAQVSQVYYQGYLQMVKWWNISCRFRIPFKWITNMQRAIP